MSPCKAPNTMTKKTILKKVMKMYEGAMARPITPMMVEHAPWTIGMPRAYMLSRTRSRMFMFCLQKWGNNEGRGARKMGGRSYLDMKW
jgi:hypothetical protein